MHMVLCVKIGVHAFKMRYLRKAIIRLSLFSKCFPQNRHRSRDTLPHECKHKYFSVGINISLFQWDVRKRYVEGKRIGLHTSPTWIISAEMRAEQGPAVLHVRDRRRKGEVTDKKEYTKVMADLSLWPVDLPLDIFVSILRLEPPYGLTFYGEAPQLFVPLIILSFLAPTLTGLLTQHWQGLCLACYKYFVNLNPIHLYMSTNGL